MKADFLTIYRSHFEKIQKCYSNIEIVEIASGRSIKNQFERDQVELRFRARDKSSRTDVIVQGSMKSSGINTPSCQFGVRAVLDMPGTFTLRRLDFDCFEYWQQIIRNDSMYLPFAPY